MTLRCDVLSGGYGPIPVVSDVTLEVREAACTALLGRNGMGKTTLLKVILGLADRYRGSVTVCGKDVGRSRTHEIIRLGVSYVPQELPLFPDLSVEENLLLGGLRTRRFYEKRLREIEEAFPILHARRKQKAGTLSGGEQTMLAVARALVSRPRLLLLDEVSEGLQPAILDRLRVVLGNFCRADGGAILLVEQNISFALSLADVFAVLKGGRLVDSGSSNDFVAERIERHMTL